jgi:hypothetical protein
MSFPEYFDENKNVRLDETLTKLSTYLDALNCERDPSLLVPYLESSMRLLFELEGKKYKIEKGNDFDSKVIKASRIPEYTKSIYFFASNGKIDDSFEKIKSLAIEGFRQNFGPAVGRSIPLDDFILFVPI